MTTRVDIKTEIVLAETLGSFSRNLLEMSKFYQTVILLYEDDLGDRIQAAWSELDRLNLLTRKVGEVLNGIEVHTFGMDPFDAHTLVELNLRESGQDPSRQNAKRSAYKSILNELITISVKIHPQGSGNVLL